MRKNELAGTIIAFILAALGMILFLSKAGIEGGQEYFEGIVLENADHHIAVKIDSSYEKLICVLGETITIEKKEVVQKRDFSIIPSNEKIRVLYAGLDSNKKKIETIFAVYVLSEIEVWTDNSEKE